VTLVVTAESVVAVASKNTVSGEMPDTRTTRALSCNVPLCVAHVAPAVTGDVTETVTLCVADPPAPVQVSVYLVVAVSVEVLVEPLVASDPLQLSEAVQEVALVVDQVRVELLPLTTLLGLAVKVTVVAGEVTETVVDCDALPPLPVHVSP
jgi:hypothetical protein